MLLRRFWRWPAAGLVLPLLITSVGWAADDDGERNDASPLRVSYHSYYQREIESVIEAAIKAGRVQGYAHAKAANNGLVKWHNGLEKALKPAQSAAVEKGETDALVRGKHSARVGNFHGATGEKSPLYLVAKAGLKNNPNFRLLWQTHWAPLLGPEKDRVFVPPDVVKPSYDKLRKQLEKEVDFVNKQHDKRVVVIIPVTDAVLELRALVERGEFPGVSKQSELFIAKKWSGHRHVRPLTAYCNFAALFGVSPEGLTPSVDHIKYTTKGGDAYSMAGVTAEQHAILQKLAWEIPKRTRPISSSQRARGTRNCHPPALSPVVD